MQSSKNNPIKDLIISVRFNLYFKLSQLKRYYWYSKFYDTLFNFALY